MYSKLGIAWAGSLLAFISLVLLPIPWVLYKQGSIPAQPKLISDCQILRKGKRGWVVFLGLSDGHLVDGHFVSQISGIPSSVVLIQAIDSVLLPCVFGQSSLLVLCFGKPFMLYLTTCQVLEHHGVYWLKSIALHPLIQGHSNP